jgi:formiminotetrahydrofolate cyclodeaminase
MPRFAERTLGEVLAALDSDAASPGAGAAAAVALAFAAACAGKALAITGKHRPLQEYLQRAQQQLAVMVRRSLACADVDAKLFEQLVHHRTAETGAELVRADDSSQALASELGGLLDQIAPAVHPVVAGDLAAARALLMAAQTIQERIRAENELEAKAGKLS